jgi:cytoskeletal protein CcmA (bactofilin family)
MSEGLQYPEVDSSVNSIIGEGTTVKGELDLNGLLRIDGTFFGKVKTNGKVLVGKHGVAECVIIAGTVVIGGKVKGEVIATERITLLSTGEMIGTIKTAHLVIEEGVIFDGKCEVIEDRDALNKVRDEHVAAWFKTRDTSGAASPGGGSTVSQGSKGSFAEPLHVPERTILAKKETAVP